MSQSELHLEESGIYLSQYSFEYPTKILNGTKTIYIDEGVKVIERYAFERFKNLETIYIPKSVETIELQAFSKTIQLKKIIVAEDNNFYKTVNGILYTKNGQSLVFSPQVEENFYKLSLMDGVKEILPFAFENFNNLHLYMPDSLETISQYAFTNSIISYINIGKNVKNIHLSAFDNMTLLFEISVDKDNKYFASKDGVLYKKDMKTLCVIPTSMKGDLKIPNTVETVYASSFNNLRLTSVNIPPLVTEFKKIYRFSITESVFEGCNDLEKIYFENKKLKLKESDFSEKADLYFSEEARGTLLKRLVTSIFPQQISPAFKKHIKDYIILSLINKKGISEEWTIEWNKYFKRNASKYYKEIISNESFLSYMIDNCLLSIKNSKELIDILNKDGNIEYSARLLEYQNNTFSIDEILDEKDKELLLDPNSKQYLKQFFNFVLKENGKYKITNYKGCETQILVPSHIEGIEVDEIGDGAFSPTKSGISEEMKRVRYNIISIELPDTITKIGPKTFQKCFKLESLKLSNKIKKLEGYPCRKRGKGFIFGCSSLHNITIPKGVKEIGKSAFEQCFDLQNITLPSTVTTIGEDAFSNCYHLISINIPPKLKKLGSGALLNCNKLTSITLPETLQEIGSYAFAYTHNLTIDMADNVEKFGISIAFRATGLKVKVKKGTKSYLNCYGQRIRIICK